MAPDEKTCPFCCETIKAGAIRCRFCLSDLEIEKEQPFAKEIISAAEVEDLLTSLVDRSLVGYDEAVGRYGLLESVRQYAGHQLSTREGSARLLDRHVAYFVQYVQKGKKWLLGPEDNRWYDTLEREHDNLRKALESCAAREGRGAEGLQLVGGLYRFWTMRGHGCEGLIRISTALDHTGGQGPSEARADAFMGMGLLSMEYGDYSTAWSSLTSALDIVRALGQFDRESGIRNTLGGIAIYQGDLEKARPLCEEALVLCRRHGNRRAEASTLMNLGTIALLTGELDEAERFNQDALAISRSVGNAQWEGLALNALGAVAQEKGEAQAAAQYLVSALTLNSRKGYIGPDMEDVEAFAMLARSMGHPIRATKLWGAAFAMRKELGAPTPAIYLARHEEEKDKLKQSLGTADYSMAWEEGRAMTRHEAISFALEPFDPKTVSG